MKLKSGSHKLWLAVCTTGHSINYSLTYKFYDNI